MSTGSLNALILVMMVIIKIPAATGDWKNCCISSMQKNKRVQIKHEDQKY